MQIALFGGSFNPPTVAHAHILWAIALKPEIEEVWVVVSGVHPDAATCDHKGHRTSFDNRLALCEALVKDVQEMCPSIAHKIKACDVERHMVCGYTYHVVSKLKENHPEHTFLWVLGADCVQELPKWEYGKELSEICNFLVISRPGYPVAKSYPMVEIPMAGISSTWVRRNYPVSQVALTTRVQSLWESLVGMGQAF